MIANMLPYPVNMLQISRLESNIQNFSDWGFPNPLVGTGNVKFVDVLVVLSIPELWLCQCCHLFGANCVTFGFTSLVVSISGGHTS